MVDFETSNNKFQNGKGNYKQTLWGTKFLSISPDFPTIEVTENYKKLFWDFAIIFVLIYTNELLL